MPKREHVLTIDAATPDQLARRLVTLAEHDRLAPGHYSAALTTLAAYAPAVMVLEQRQPKGVLYARIATPEDVFELSIDPRGRVSYW